MVAIKRPNIYSSILYLYLRGLFVRVVMLCVNFLPIHNVRFNAGVIARHPTHLHLLLLTH